MIVLTDQLKKRGYKMGFITKTPLSLHFKLKKILKRSTGRGNKIMTLSQTHIKLLKNQLAKHNSLITKSYQKISLQKLKRSAMRGFGAAYTNPKLRLSRGLSASQWSAGRTDQLLKNIRSKSKIPKNKLFDLDLYSSDHPTIKSLKK